MRAYLLVLSVWCLSVLYFTTVDTGSTSECFYVGQDWCEQILNSGNHCDTKKSDIRTIQVICCNITNEKQIQDFIRSKMPDDRDLSGIHIRDSNFTIFNANTFDKMKSLASLSITHSFINRFLGTFDDLPGLTCLNMSMNSIFDMSPYLLLKLVGLRNIVIRNNTNLTIMPLLPWTRGFIELDLSGNSDLQCSHLINLTQIIYEKRILINQVNKNKTICLPPSVLFDNPYYVSMEQIDQVTEIFKYCPKIEDRNCTCLVDSSDFSENGTLIYQASVNCSNKELVSLPNVLPPHTRVLDISNNKIKSLEGIANSSYDNIFHLYADNNNITSLVPLEGSKFLDYFGNLSLTGNKIDQIQDHIFANVFDHYKGRFLFLARNFLKCECPTATRTKLWLIAFKEHVVDYNEVYSNCDIRMKVIEMDQKDYCPVPNGFGSYLKYLIAAEISIFALLVGKVSYDYYVFKTYGYLPWPASRMPKLPCDWCFET